jgi:hypothetical protein
MDLKEIGFQDVDWILLGLLMKAVMNTVTNLQFS